MGRNLRLLALVVLVGIVLGAILIDRNEPPPVRVALPMWRIDTSGVAEMRLALENGADVRFARAGDDWQGGDPLRINAALLLLERPEGARQVATAPFDAAAYGLDSPDLVIVLGMADGPALTIRVGDATPDGRNRYVLPPDGAAVHAVPSSWHDAMARLVPAQ